ncbi:hypothetical protein ITJ54_04665 [Curtobacterium sp. VKM Ac-2865]|uniref:putative Ig domain-containing protein n=1 Tax=Curtobacterium sp. VKM Ac-2865 TaxID=2783817 RepID=UPI00188CBD94|nr:putative Ig domain-containing protein [Curtobacterium sp. VKM Ac-2865]MBF4581956.1 hypothetical protein [Curtobacterium sp. VKM Ac-2865]
MHRSTAFVRRACAVGTATALVGLMTGFGVMTATTASAAEGTAADTAVAAPAVPGADATGATGTDATGTDATDATPSLPTDAGTPAPGGTDAATPAPTATPTADAPTAPATSAPTAQEPTAPVTIAAAPAITIAGQAKIGSKLTAETDGGVKYAWSVDGTVVETRNVYTPTDVALIGKTVVLTITDVITGETNSASTAPVLPNPTFADATTADAPLALSATAGDAFSHTFAVAGTTPGDVTYAVAWSDPEQADPEDPTYTPDLQLPDGVTLDPKTGVLSGTSETADYFDFAITATSQGVSTTQYVELTVEAAAPLGVQVFSMDKADFAKYAQGDADGTFTSWIIDTDGSVLTDVTTITSTDDGGTYDDVVTPGGTVTVKQGGTLIVNGGLVDRFGNQITDADGNSSPIALTSDVASDVVAPDPDLGDFIDGFYNVTFPHASTHRLTVTAGDFSTAFDVSVVPTAVTTPAAVPPVSAPVAQPIGTVPAHVATTAKVHRLAYTGTDSTNALPWALAMLLAGAGLVGVRTLRRRAQR